MTDSIRLIFDEDGTAREYKDDYDIVIHCETEDEQAKAMEKLERLCWIRPEDKLPKPLESVLICRPKRTRNDPLTVDLGYLRPDGTWRIHGTPLSRIRGWMPCPAPMEGEE